MATSASSSSFSSPALLVKKRKERVWTWIFVDIILLSLIVSVVNHALYGALPLYIEAIGGKAAFSGLLTAVFALAAGVGRILTGVVTSRFSCRFVMIGAATIFTVANLMPLVLPGLGVLIVIRFLQGVGFSGISTASANASAEVLPRNRLGEGMGYYGLGQSVSTVLGPSLGYFLFNVSQTTQLGTSVIWYSVAVLAAILIVLAYVCRYTRPDSAVGFSGLKSSEIEQSRPAHGSLVGRVLDSFYERGALSMALVCGLFMFSASFYSSFLMLYAQRNEIPNPQMFFLGTAVAMFAVRLLGAKLGDTFPPLWVLLPSFATGMLSFWLTIFSHSTTMLTLVGILYGTCIGLNFPLLNTLAYRLTPSTRWHASTATFFLGCDIGWAAGAYVWGIIIDLYGFSQALFFAGVVIFLAATGVTVALRMIKFKEKPE